MDIKTGDNSKYSVLTVIGYIIGIILRVYIIELAWNNFMPAVFSLPEINFVSSLCLMLLCNGLIKTSITNKS